MFYRKSASIYNSVRHSYVSESYQLLVTDEQNNMNTKTELHMKVANYCYNSPYLNIELINSNLPRGQMLPGMPKPQISSLLFYTHGMKNCMTTQHWSNLYTKPVSL
jgi:hypothetical protein